MILAVDSANRLWAGEIEPPHLLALLCDHANGLADLLAEKGVTVVWLWERLAARCEGYTLSAAFQTCFDAKSGPKPKQPYFLFVLALVLRVQLRICRVSGKASLAGHF